MYRLAKQTTVTEEELKDVFAHFVIDGDRDKMLIAGGSVIAALSKAAGKVRRRSEAMAELMAELIGI